MKRLPSTAINKPLTFFVTLAIALLLISGNSIAADTCENYEAVPPFLTQGTAPNVLYMLDNSGSMKNPIYKGSNAYTNKTCIGFDSEYDASEDYYGMFGSASTYKYDSTIPVDLCAYGQSNSDTGLGLNCSTNTKPYDVKVNDTLGAFVEDSCTLGLSNNCWSGNFLNWMVTRRIDAARKVLIGGKLEHQDGYNYRGSGIEWKILGNNEPEDRFICKQDDNSGYLTPYPQNTTFKIESPANAGLYAESYDPYAKITPVAPRLIYNIDGDVIGEFGTIKGLDHNSQRVFLNNNYTTPVVVISPPSVNGTDPSVIRLSNVNAGSDYFDVYISEWNSDGNHLNTEEAFYFVFEDGHHTLPNNKKLEAGKTANKAQTTSSSSQNTTFDTAFSAPPVVLTTNQRRNNGSNPNLSTVNSRVTNITTTGITVRYNLESTSEGKARSLTHYIAAEKGEINIADFFLKVDTQTNFDENFRNLNFGKTTTAFIANVQNFDSGDNGWLRYQNLSGSSAELKVEDTSSYNPSNEEIGFIAVYNTYFHKGYNIALVVDEKPEGLLQEVQTDVRQAISFYRYQKDSNIYNGEWAHGGTLHLAIPQNPFVKSDSDIGGYRYLNTHLKADIADIVDGIEHYPLVWGTTPLAENLYEIGNYFRQVPPYYADKPVISDDDIYGTTDEWDPYTYEIEGSYYDVRCAKSYIILFTDGEPYRDLYVPTTDSTISGYNYPGIGNYDQGTGDDEVANFSTSDLNGSPDDRNYYNMLDDVAKYLNHNTSTGTNQDLRTDLDDNQNIEIYTVGFGATSAARQEALGDTATNGKGDYYDTEDGAELSTALTSAITSILKKTSAGSSLSVLSERATAGSLINQALFFPEKVFSDGSDTFDVSWTGALNGYWFYTTPHVSNIRENNYDPFAFYTLDIYEDNVLDFQIDASGNLVVDHFAPVNDPGKPNDGGKGVTADGTYGNLDEVAKVYEAGEILKDRNVNANPSDTEAGRRIIYGVTESNTMTEFVQSNYDDFDNYFQLITADMVDCLGTVDTSANKNQASKNLISYVRGAADDFSSQTNILESCRARTVDTSGKLWKLGDIIYSTPRAVDYKFNNDEFSLLFTGANDGMLHAFKTGKLRKNQAGANQAVALCDSDNGGCTSSEIGDEAWAFIPKNAMPYLKYLTNPEYEHIYTVDLPPYVIETDDQKILIGGMRFGGSTGCTKSSYWCGDENGDGIIDQDSDGSPLQVVPPHATPATVDNDTLGLSAYFALDITDPYAPKYLWDFSHVDLGFSYSGPVVITRNVGGVKKHTIMFVSGPLNYKADIVAAQDLKLFFLEMNSDFTSYTLHAVDGQGDPGFIKENNLTSSLTASFGNRLFNEGIDVNSDGETDAVVFASNQKLSSGYQSNVFLVAPTDDAPTDGSAFSWEIDTIANVDAPITSQVVYGNCYDNKYLYFGTGRWYYKTDTPGQDSSDTNSMWGVEFDECLAALTDGDSSTQCNTINDSGISHSGDDVCSDIGSGTDVFWQMQDMEPRGSGFLMERVFSDPNFVSDITLFTTMQPSSDLCDFGGRTRVWAFNCRSGHDIFNGCSGYTSTPPAGALLIQLSGGNIEETMLNSTNLSETGGLTTDWFKGVPPESAPPFVPHSTLDGEIILWIER